MFYHSRPFTLLLQDEMPKLDAKFPQAVASDGRIADSEILIDQVCSDNAAIHGYLGRRGIFQIAKKATALSRLGD